MINNVDFAAALEACDDPAVGKAVRDALSTLFDRDRKLLELDAAERTIAAQIANYLRPHFERSDIDVDYNRMGDAPKTVAYDELPELVYPDIIVHMRGDNTANLLVIELKKDSNREPKDRDIRKLRAYRRDLEYRHALFLRLGTGKSSGAVLECEWIDA
ncbi:MAG: hypothetical protein WDO72_04895 [Pseudomonadota bacterium]